MTTEKSQENSLKSILNKITPEDRREIEKMAKESVKALNESESD